MLAASYEAKAYGVTCRDGRSAGAAALPRRDRRSPRDVEAYTEASKDVFEIFDDTSPAVEGLSIDEAFLDARGMERIAGTPAEIAERLRARGARARSACRSPSGSRATKFLAKVASAVGKPDGLLVVPPGGELEFLHALPVRAPLGRRAGDVAQAARARDPARRARSRALDEPTLVEMLGRAAGRKLHALAHNRDPRRVQTRARRRSIGAQNAFGRRPRHRSEAELDAVLVGLVDRVGRRMRTANRACRTVTLRLRFDDFARATRSRTLPEATAETPAVLAAARDAAARRAADAARAGHARWWGSRSPGSTTATRPSSRSPSRTAGRGRSTRRWTACASATARTSITRAVLLGKDRGITPPLLPDE